MLAERAENARLCAAAVPRPPPSKLDTAVVAVRTSTSTRTSSSTCSMAPVAPPCSAADESGPGRGHDRQAALRARRRVGGTLAEIGPGREAVAALFPRPDPPITRWPSSGATTCLIGSWSTTRPRRRRRTPPTVSLSSCAEGCVAGRGRPRAGACGTAVRRSRSRSPRARPVSREARACPGPA